MGCMLRSDYMTLCDIYLQHDVAFEFLNHLGEMGCTQFIDLNPELQAFQRNYVIEVCRFSEMERKLWNIEAEMKHHNISMPDQQGDLKKMPPFHELLAYENILDKWDNDLQEMTYNEIDLMKSFLELTELQYVLQYCGPLLGEAEIRRESLFGSGKKKGKDGERGKKRAQTAGTATPGGGDALGGMLVVVTGVVKRKTCYTFEKMLWRISHGNIYYKQANEDKILIDPKSKEEIRKVAFLAVIQGKQLAVRVRKICSGFQVNTYPCPNTYTERMELMEKLDIRISDLQQVLDKTTYLRCKALRSVSRHWEEWMTQIRKAKAIYHTMNMFNVDVTKKCLIGQCWIPNDDFVVVNDTLHKLTESLCVPSFTSKIDTPEMPPTFHRTNKFTRGFQNLINAYGDSTYRELNPGLYTIITFPFLFAMMFGDVGHGFIMFMFAAWMWKNEEQFMAENSTNEIWNIFFGGRYVVLLMGLFSMFTGFCYNDMFAKAMSITSSYWMNLYSVEELSMSEYIDIDPSAETGTPYFFGKDPIWSLAKNKIMFENSIKMKLSIIIGIVHMMFGIILSFFNHRYFKRYYSILLQFFPELFFLTFLFFWLVVLIYYKWFTYSAKSIDPERDTACAPQILILFIDMALMSETKPVNDCKEGYMFEGQRLLQTCLVFSALVCVPVLLMGTPLYKRRMFKRKRQEALAKLQVYRGLPEIDKKKEQYLEDEVEKYSAPFGELMIHQGVHTIEFVLSTISHTASYLRLWALSLAHAQLSEMLWTMILSKLALHDHSVTGSIKLFIIFAVWAVFTIAILVVMEGLSAFLHTLRLHWVEFMSKFYSGGGYPFRPFSFEVILESASDKGDLGCVKLLAKD